MRLNCWSASSWTPRDSLDYKIEFVLAQIGCLLMLRCMTPRLVCFPCLFLLAAAFFATARGLPAAEVQIRDERLTLPTYGVARPDPNPRFYQRRTYQGARATFYPYPVYDVLTGVKAGQSYRALYLENPYLQICVLPELGGRIFSASDKSNGYDFFYRQHVVKPALIGMLGAWISGGVEWNVPHHHRASSFLEVDSVTRTNEDGSKTIWVGETELRHGLNWLIGLTLYPDRSYIEMSMRVTNPTPLAHPMLFWINPAVHANEQYQVLFPPSTEWAVQHAKPEFASWPIARQFYGGTDYTHGVDISWWKNHPSPVSFFAWNSEEDWFGGYDHGRDAGVLHWADHHVVPGKKFFEWGNGAEGEMWSEVLSDQDGPYLELMAGAWSDNQPDYSWLQPGEVRDWKHWWFPIRNLGGVKAANRDAALNLELSNNAARITLNSTRPLRDARVRLELSGRELSHTTVSISPDRPFAMTQHLPLETKPEQLRVVLNAASGEELLSYSPAQSKGTPKPRPVERPKAPKDYATADELYFTAQRIEQLYSPAFEAAPYYREILQCDSNDYRANTALGILLCRQWRWAEASTHLSNALSRSSENYIRPQDGQANYYLGVALRAQDLVAPAVDAFHRAAWSQGWKAPSYLALAEVAASQTNYPEALELADSALSAGDRNSKVLGLKTALLRRMGRHSEANAAAQAVIQRHPLDFTARYERLLLEPLLGQVSGRSEGKDPLYSLMRGEVQSHLGLAFDYSEQGFWEEAMDVLSRLGNKGSESPMVQYALGCFATRRGQIDAAARYFKAAAQAPPDFCFPSRFSEVTVLQAALKANPSDARAAYYLGNAYYDQQPLEAIRLWEQARTLDPAFPLVHRNLGLGYAQTERNGAKAIASYEKAVELNPADPRALYELDLQYESEGAAVAKRLGQLASHRASVELRDDTTTRLITLWTASGASEQALELLGQRRFHNWEGSGELHDLYVEACLARGQELLRQNRPSDALAAFKSALEYPRNQEVGRPKRDRRAAEIFYFVGLAQEAIGSAEQANEAFSRSAEARESASSEGQYFKALSLQKLGKGQSAGPLFAAMLRAGEIDLERGARAVDYFAKFGEKQSERVRLAQAHFIAGLGCAGQHKTEEASAHFAKALSLHPAHLGVIRFQSGTSR